ncbi:MAG: hypothetical protein JNJ48_01890 [Phycisphaerae bacterium]|nr:hypothetical protein [Phycisphaerae bacterium]
MSTACAPSVMKISGLNGPGADLGARMVRLARLAADEHLRQVRAGAERRPEAIDQAHRLRLAMSTARGEAR